MDIKKQLLLGLFLIPSLAFGNPHCSVEQSVKTHTPTPIQIEGTRNYKSAIVKNEAGTKSCFVAYEVMHKGTWYPVHGEQDWTGHQSATTVCNVAKQSALQSFMSQYGDILVMKQEEMVCADGDKSKIHTIKEVGQIMNINKIKGDPARPNPFMYQGTKCYWVRDVEWKAEKLNSFQGVACQVDGEQYVLVDKF